jgi:hypothetical protein
MKKKYKKEDSILLIISELFLFDSIKIKRKEQINHK